MKRTQYNKKCSLLYKFVCVLLTYLKTHTQAYARDEYPSWWCPIHFAFSSHRPSQGKGVQATPIAHTRTHTYRLECRGVLLGISHTHTHTASSILVLPLIPLTTALSPRLPGAARSNQIRRLRHPATPARCGYTYGWCGNGWAATFCDSGCNDTRAHLMTISRARTKRLGIFPWPSAQAIGREIACD